MFIVTNPIDWLRLCELINAPTTKGADIFTMADIIDGTKIVKRARPIWPVVGEKVGGDNIILSREGYDLSLDILERFATGFTSTRAEFYLRNKPTPLTGRKFIDAKIRLQRKTKDVVNVNIGKGRTLPSTAFKYGDYADFTTVKGWWQALEEIYVLSRLSGMKDEMLPE